MIANINASTVAFNPKIAFRIYFLLAAILYHCENFGVLFMTQDIIISLFLHVLSRQNIFILFIYLVTHKTLHNMNKSC